MAKQTFTTGQVLTAAQMTSLQQTAMGGGSATAKTASYTLVAADAGTSVLMNSASATTITVNTALFEAGDTVYIQNIGTGISTITAGTATVTTSAALALAQWEGGTLYFTSTSAAIFLKAAGAAASSGGMTLLSTTSMSGSSSITLSSISQDYVDLYILFKQFQTSTGTAGQLRIATNGTTNIASGMQMYAADYGTPSLSGYASDYIKTATINPADDGKTGVLLQFFNYCGSWQARRFYQLIANSGDTTNGDGLFTNGIVRTNAAITSLVISQSNGGTFNNGTIYLYGVK